MLIENRNLLLYVDQHTHTHTHHRPPPRPILRELNEIMKNEFCIFDDWLFKMAVVLETREETQGPDSYAEA